MTGQEPEEWLGQVLGTAEVDGPANAGKWIDYARGHEAESRRWQAQDPTQRRVVHWIKRTVLIPNTDLFTEGSQS